MIEETTWIYDTRILRGGIFLLLVSKSIFVIAHFVRSPESGVALLLFAYSVAFSFPFFHHPLVLELDLGDLSFSHPFSSRICYLRNSLLFTYLWYPSSVLLLRCCIYLHNPLSPMVNDNSLSFNSFHIIYIYLPNNLLLNKFFFLFPSFLCAPIFFFFFLLSLLVISTFTSLAYATGRHQYLANLFWCT